MELLSDEKKLEEERETASQTKNRYKGTGNSGGNLGSSYNRYGGETYDGMGSDGPSRKKVEERQDRGRERERESRHGGYSGSGTNYDPHTGSSNLFKKLGIQDKKNSEDGKKKDDDEDDIQFPDEKKQPPKIPSQLVQAPPQKQGSKFLPPPPSKTGGSGAASTGTGLGAPPKKGDSGILFLIQGF